VARSVRPNIVLIVPDQFRADALSCAGSTYCRTPNLDRLAETGVRFDRAYTVTALCTPTRSALLSGRYPHNGGLMNNTHERDRLHDEMRQTEGTYPQLLRAAGYRQVYVGKWHIGRIRGPVEWGYDRYITPAGAAEYRRKNSLPDPAEHIDKAGPLMPPSWRQPFYGRCNVPIESTTIHYLTDQAIEALRELVAAQRDDGRPFHLRLDFPDPHFPHILPEPFASMYDPRKIEPWPNFDDTLENKPQGALALRKQWCTEDLTWEEFWAHLVAHYAGHCSLVDYQVGRVLKTLEELGVAEETVVIFTTDHGDLTGAHRLFNKGPVPYEETYRIPLIIHWPGRHEPGRVVREFVQIHDLMPTMLEAADLYPTHPVDGRSLLPLLTGRAPDDWRDCVFCCYYGNEIGLYTQRILITERYKFVWNGHAVNELYDLQEDPHELRNLVPDPRYQQVAKDLAKRLLEQMRRYDDPYARWSPTTMGLLPERPPAFGQKVPDYMEM